MENSPKTIMAGYENILLRTIDTERTAWIGNLAEQFYLIINPVFHIKNHHPYRSSMAIGIYCSRGSVKGKVNLVEYELSSDSFLIILPNQILESAYVSDDFEGTYIVMSEAFLEGLNIRNSFDVYNSVNNMPYTKLCDRAKSSIESYFAMCRSTISIEENPNRIEIVKLITKAFFLGFGHFMHRVSEIPQGKPSSGAELISRFVNLVEKNYRMHRDVEFYANEMNFSPKYLSRVVKSVSGRKALHWIERYVILDAKSQLASTNESVKQISFNLNFPSQSFFGKYFYRVTGLSPLEYRQQVRRENENINIL